MVRFHELVPLKKDQFSNKAKLSIGEKQDDPGLYALLPVEPGPGLRTSGKIVRLDPEAPF